MGKMTRFDVAVIGGDRRSTYMVQLLEEKGYKVICYGTQGVPPRQAARSLAEAMELSTVIVGGIPFAKNGRLRQEEGLADMDIENFNRMLQAEHVLFGGVIPAAVTQKCREKGIACYDFMQDEAITIFNAIATAEGAVLEALRNQETNIHAGRSLILGYGRCGRILAEKLKGLSAKVTVCCRNEAALAYAEAYGMKTLPFTRLEQKIGSFEYIYNTIPAEVLTASILRKVERSALIIDIASGAGGVDYGTAEALGIRALLCPGLPGKYAAKASAGRLVEFVVQKALVQI